VTYELTVLRAKAFHRKALCLFHVFGFPLATRH
jgi:hypothetical protein